jgi:hypothetical protein
MERIGSLGSSGEGRADEYGKEGPTGPSLSPQGGVTSIAGGNAPGLTACPSPPPPLGRHLKTGQRSSSETELPYPACSRPGKSILRSFVTFRWVELRSAALSRGSSAG